MGGPSESSSGRTLNFATEYTLIAATIAKTPMQIATVNHRTTSIRLPSFEFSSGSQGRKMATAVAAAAASSAIVTTRTMAPLRTGSSLLNVSVLCRS